MFVLAVLLTGSCQGQQGLESPPLSSATWQWDQSDGPGAAKWSDVLGWAIDQGFNPLEGAVRYGDACWQLDARVVGLRTRLYVGPDGRIFETFPPSYCRANGQRSEIAALPVPHPIRMDSSGRM
jgi:hypothetical protein